MFPFLLAALLAVPSEPGGLDVVELDVDSGIVDRRLPFDVPFVLTGTAPPGAIQVEVLYQEKRLGETDFGEVWVPAPGGASLVGRDGRFRTRLGPFEVDRDFRVRLVFDRRLSTNDAASLRREVAAALERQLSTVDGSWTAESGARVEEAIALAFERALNGGAPLASGRGSLEVEARGTLFTGDVDPNAVAALTRDIRERQAQRRESLRLYRETAVNLERELTRLRESLPLRTLLEELERRPELDPRNPRNVLYLSEAAFTFVSASQAEIAAASRGRSRAASTSMTDVETSFRPEDADAVRSQYLVTARALRELRDWLSSLVTPGAIHRDVADRVINEARTLDSAALVALQSLANDEASALRRAERWAEVLETYLYDLEKALTGRERAIEEAALEIESLALSASIRQTTTTDVLTTRANLYVGLDIGALYSPELERAAAYFGANIYFAPVNKSASLSYAGGLKRRLSVTVGVTLSELVLEDDPRVEPLLGSRYNLALGIGYRFAKSLRVSGGTLLVLKNDPNPLVVDRTLAWTPYFAFSFDVDIVGALRKASR